MIDKQEAAIFKSKQDFNQNKEKILEYISSSRSDRQNLSTTVYNKFTKRGRDFR